MTEKEKRGHMKRQPCSPQNSILEGDLDLAAKQETIKQIIVNEVQDGFFVVVKLFWADDKDWYLTTRRNRTEPRLYKDLKRLNDHLKETAPDHGFDLVRNQLLPQQISTAPKVKNLAAKAKQKPTPKVAKATTKKRDVR